MNALTRSLFVPLALLLVSGFVPAALAAEIQGREMTLPATEHPVKVEFFRAPGNAKRPTIYMVYYYSDSDIADRKANAPGVSVRRFPAWAKLVSDLAGDAKKM